MNKEKLSKNANKIGDSKTTQKEAKISKRIVKKKTIKVSNKIEQTSISNNKNSINIINQPKNANNLNSGMPSTKAYAQNNAIKRNSIKQKIDERAILKPKKTEDDNNIKRASDGKKESIIEKNKIEMPLQKFDISERELAIQKDKIKDFESQLKESTNKLCKANEELNLLKQKLKDENNKNIELKLNINKIQEENKNLKAELNGLNDCKRVMAKNDVIEEKMQIKIKEKKARNYDIEIRLEPLSKLIKGWDIKYGVSGMNNYIDMKSKDMLLIGILGLKNRGKSYILSKLLKEDEYKKEDNDNLYLKYITNKNKNFNYAIIDTPGINKSLKKDENINSIKVIERYNNQLDNFIINFILKKCNFILCIVGLLDYNEQKLINKLKLKDIEYKDEFKQFKKIFIIHNLKELSTKIEIINYINDILLKSLTFNLIEKEGNLAQNISNINYNTKYFIEKNINEELEIYHLIIAKENTEAGNYYNESTYNFIIQQYNSFHSFKKFDIINEIKEEIKLISKNIFTKQINSLDDFENIDNKIKLKNKFEIYNNNDESINTDFSYLTLKPKYSYYKINNNTQLLIIIEMPGKIIDQKFICNKIPKNGYYIMTFSGKKEINLPDNIDEQKKNEFFFSNIEDGYFKEEIKINIDKFQLRTTKYEKKIDGNGVYEYYFNLINDNSSSDEEII